MKSATFQLRQRWVCVLVLTGLTLVDFTGSCFGGVPQKPTIEFLGYLENSEQTAIHAISNDGSTLVGSASGFRSRAVKWNWDSGLAALQSPGPNLHSFAFGVSHDGEVIAGHSAEEPPSGAPYTNYQQLFWRDENGLENLGGMPGNPRFYTSDLSGDGLIAVGARDDGSHYTAYRWPTAGEPGFLPDGGATGSLANAVNYDGTVIVGSADPLNRDAYAFRWSANGGLIDLGHLANVAEPYALQTALDVSSDGNTIVGVELAEDAPGQGFTRIRSFKWTQETGMRQIGSLDANLFNVAVEDVSPDGRIMGGQIWNKSTFQADAVLWDDVHGMRYVRDILTDAGVQIPFGWRLEGVQGVSEDGRVIYGYATESNSPRGPVPFVAVLTPVPEPGAALLLIVSLSAVCLRRLRRQAGQIE